MDLYTFKTILSAFLISCVTIKNAYTQLNTTVFKHLTIDDGLSQNSINCIHQDKYGFMWIGTQDGLNRYDGYNFIEYRHDRNNKNSISNNYIWDIKEDKEGILWIATFGGGLNRLDPLTGEFSYFNMTAGDPNSFPSNRLFSIAETPDGILWIGSNEGLIRFDKSTKTSQLLLSQKKPDGTNADNYIGIVTTDNYNNVWLRSDSGLTFINTKTLSTQFFTKSPYSNAQIIGNVTHLFHEDGKLYVSCSAGLLEINLKTKTDRVIVSSQSLGFIDENIFIQDFLKLGRHNFAIGTNKGLAFYIAEINELQFYQNNGLDEKSISHDNILSIFKSSDDILWIGTRNGLNILDSGTPGFMHVRSIPGNNVLSNKNVNSFIDENDSLLWIGTTDGLNVYNRYENKYTVFRKDEKNKNGLTSSYILCLYMDSKGNKWTGTRGGGFYKIETPSNGKTNIKRIKPSNDTATAISIHFITEDKKGNLWLGTGGGGLWKYDPEKNMVKKYAAAKDGSGPGHPFVFTILEDSYGNIWLGTPSGGLNLFDPDTERFIYFINDPDKVNSLSNDIVLSLHEDINHNLWIGTSSGLNKLIPKLNSDIFEEFKNQKLNTKTVFKNFGYEQGFPNDVIYGILEDSRQNLWISTNKGMAVFNTVTETLHKTYDISDGLQSNEFNQNGYYKNKHGVLYFGGVNGFNFFHPDKLMDNKFIPPVVITGISLFNKKVPVGSSDSTHKSFFLDKELFGMNEISLSWKHDVITFDFAALSYHSPEKNQFSYKLEGFNEDWVFAGNSLTATYTNLNPGKYVFRVRACNNSGVWNESGTYINIHISTPPWLSWYAYLFYTLLFSSMVYVFIRYRINKATREIKVQTQIEKARTEEREEFRKKSAADFHDEAGNKITKITLFTEMAKTETEDKAQLQNYLNKIELNISELSTGMRDFLWVMDPQHDTLFDTVTRLKDFGDSMLSELGIQFIVRGMNNTFQNIVLPMNTRRAVLQIFKEAMHNCAKHANAAEVILTVTLENNFILFSLQDNGNGFDINEERSRNNYGLTIMKTRAEKINAELTINSEKNNGTNITLKCNMPQMGNV